MDCITVSTKANRKFNRAFRQKRKYINFVWILAALILAGVALLIFSPDVVASKVVTDVLMILTLASGLGLLYSIGRLEKSSTKTQMISWILHETLRIENKVTDMAGKGEGYWKEFENAKTVLDFLETCEWGHYFTYQLGEFKNADSKNRIKSYSRRKDLTAVQTLKFYDFVLDAQN